MGLNSFMIRHAALIFTCKTFFAAMLALLAALWLDLPRPYWAMATVYITSQAPHLVLVPPPVPTPSRTSSPPRRSSP